MPCDGDPLRKEVRTRKVPRDPKRIEIPVLRPIRVRLSVVREVRSVSSDRELSTDFLGNRTAEREAVREADLVEERTVVLVVDRVARLAEGRVLPLSVCRRVCVRCPARALAGARCPMRPRLMP